jgi:hypothetical protein
MPENPLAMAERHVLEGERRIARQWRTLALLEHLGKNESAELARDILATFEKIQVLFVADRDRLKFQAARSGQKSDKLIEETPSSPFNSRQIWRRF